MASCAPADGSHGVRVQVIYGIDITASTRSTGVAKFGSSMQATKNGGTSDRLVQMLARVRPLPMPFFAEAFALCLCHLYRSPAHPRVAASGKAAVENSGRLLFGDNRYRDSRLKSLPPHSGFENRHQ
jgi:hypothetical protein